MKLINHNNISKMIKNKNISLRNVNKKEVMKLYFFMLRLRLCEEALSEEYHPADQMRCPVHFCSGQEATPASLNILLENKDYLYSHHRSHGYYLYLFSISFCLRIKYPMYFRLPSTQIYALHILIKFLKIVEMKKINFFLVGGCLLGAVRQKSFAGRPSDIDLGIKEKEL